MTAPTTWADAPIEEQTAIDLGDVLVVKLGGGAGLDIEASCDDLAAIAAHRPLVVAHGVSEEADRLAAERGVPAQTLTSPSGHSSRYTDPATREIFVEAAGNVNETIVSALRARGIDAVPVFGSIGGERKRAIRAVVNGRVRVVRDDYSGSITGVDAMEILDVLENGGVPVLPPMAHSDADGALNIDGDRGAAAVAGALGAAELVILSNVRGLYRDFPNEDSFVSEVDYATLDTALNTWAQGRMKRKVLGAQEALDGGVNRVVISDGRVENPLQNALNGAGTAFIR